LHLNSNLKTLTCTHIINADSLFFLLLAAFTAFGFRRVKAGVFSYLCGIWPVYGETLARQRCQCNGSLWPRLGDCGGWWCDEWMCDIFCCSYRYTGLADADETAFAAGIALQAYFEGRKISKEDMDKCLEYYREHISEKTDPEGRKRDVCW